VQQVKALAVLLGEVEVMQDAQRCQVQLADELE
jgi:hypothetical protein